SVPLLFGGHFGGDGSTAATLLLPSVYGINCLLVPVPRSFWNSSVSNRSCGPGITSSLPDIATHVKTAIAGKCRISVRPCRSLNKLLLGVLCPVWWFSSAERHYAFLAFLASGDRSEVRYSLSVACVPAFLVARVGCRYLQISARYNRGRSALGSHIACMLSVHGVRSEER